MLKDDLAKLQQQTKLKDERIASLRGTINELRRNVAVGAEVLALKASAEDVEAAITRQRRTGKA